MSYLWEFQFSSEVPGGPQANQQQVQVLLASGPSKNHRVIEWSPYLNQRISHKKHEFILRVTFLELSGTSSVTTHKFAAPESSKLYWTVSKVTGNPLEVLEPCLKIPAEVLLTMLILSTVVFNLLWRFPFRKRAMNQGQRRKENMGRRTHSCMEKHTLHAILRSWGTGGGWSCSVPYVSFPSPHQGQVFSSSLRIKLLKQLPPVKADPLQCSTKVIRKQKADM